jgi:hypothetical protein
MEVRWLRIGPAAMKTVLRALQAIAAVLGVGAPGVAQAQVDLPLCPGHAPPSEWTACLGTASDPSAGTRYSGEYRGGLFHGFGVLQTGGTVYAGQFQDGLRHGEGMLRLEGGGLVSARFERGVRVGPPSGTGAAPGTPAAGQGGPPPSTESRSESWPEPPQPGALRPERGFATGRVTMADGSPLPATVERVDIQIQRAAQQGGASPSVQTDGTFRQALPAGQYRFAAEWVLVGHRGRTLRLPLEPVGEAARQPRESADGIVQNFVWKVTGPTPLGLAQGSRPDNHTHWYGLPIQTSPAGYRWDWLPQGTRLTLTPPPPRACRRWADPGPRGCRAGRRMEQHHLPRPTARRLRTVGICHPAGWAP